MEESDEQQREAALAADALEEGATLEGDPSRHGPPDPGVLEERLGHRFGDPDLLRRALTHRSYANEREDDVVDNEVMEFLGDAVLGFVISELLYRRHPDLSEGEMSKVKAYLVSADSLARQAEELDLGRFLMLGKGEEKTAGRAKDSLLSNAFEAVTAAIYLDAGMEAARGFIERLLWPDAIEGLRRESSINDFKSRLQERLQAETRTLPVYQVVAEYGPDHDKVFQVEVRVDDRPIAEGEGRTKKAAEQEAAEAALETLEEPEPES